MREISRREFMGLGAAGIAGGTLAVAFGYEFVVPELRKQLNGEKYPKYRMWLPDFTGPVAIAENAGDLIKPTIGIKEIFFYPHFEKNLLFYLLTYDENHRPNTKIDSTINKVGFAEYKPDFDPESAEIYGKVGSTASLGDEELDILLHIRINSETQYSGFLAYQKMPPYGTELVYLIKSGVLIDNNGTESPTAELRSRITLSRNIVEQQA